MVKAFVERRKGKVNEEQAAEILKDHNYFGTMLVYMEKLRDLYQVQHTQLQTQ